jgi:hypothetical protein
MRKISTIFTGCLLMGTIMVACKDEFLDQPPQGTFSEDVLKTQNGIEGVLIGAYSLLDGVGTTTDNPWRMTASNWTFGSVASDESYKGSDPGDQPEINQMERFEVLPNNGYLNAKWTTVYDAISRSNNVLQLLPDVLDISDADKTRIEAEARFLRAHYHFEAKKVWNNVPYVDENTIDLSDFNSAKLANDVDIWPMIEADFQFAYDNLPATQAQIGRANKWAAAAFLAKAYMFQKKYADARPLLNTIIEEGVNAAGVKYQLTENFFDNFTPGLQNNSETVFAVQNSVNDGGAANNASAGEVLNFPHNGKGPGGCCGFWQPSHNLVNSYKTDANGLPMPDSFMDDYSTDDEINDGEAFDPFTSTMDPRVDWTVGRTGVPYLDWGVYEGNEWVRDPANGGPYSPKKNSVYKSQVGTFTDGGSWTAGYTANNYNLIRFADVLLWAAEAEVEAGSLERARELVNIVRARAANEDGWVKKYVDPEDPSKGFTEEPADDYNIGLYTAAWTDQAAAREAVHFERKLELGMEGHRFFDLVRYGTAAEVLNAYLAKESEYRVYLKGAQFEENCDEYYPIPEVQIVLSVKEGEQTLEQKDCI